MSKIKLIVKVDDKFYKMTSVKMSCFHNCERAVTNNINVTSCGDKQCISFKNHCSIWCTKAAVCLLPFLSHQNQLIFCAFSFRL